MEHISAEKIELFLHEVMEVERRFAHELKNVKTTRQAEVRELVNRFSAKELER